MALDYSIYQKCRPKLSVGSGSVTRGSAMLLQMLKIIGRFEQLERAAEARGDSVYDIKVPFVDLSMEGAKEMELDYEGVYQRKTTLDQHASYCDGCPANVLGTPYGCFGRMSYPISVAAETWLMRRIQPGQSVGGRMLVAALRDFNYDGVPIATLRARKKNPVFEGSRPVSVTVSTGFGLSKRVSSDQVLQAMLSVGRLEPVHCFGVLMWFGCLRVGKGVLDEAGLVRAVLAASTFEERVDMVQLDIGEAVDDAGVEGVQVLLTALFVAWLNGVQLTMDG